MIGINYCNMAAAATCHKNVNVVTLTLTLPLTCPSKRM